jgi:hypothetical protein
MPRLRIIALEQPDRNDPRTYRYVLWADVPTARQPFYAQAGKVSEWRDATAPDNAALASGAVVEHADTLRVPPGATLAQIKTFLEARHADFQADITNNNPWVRYGMTFDGTTWVNGGVA